jgi:hypothetical protein
MEKSKNVWLQLNSARIRSVTQELEQERFKSSYPGAPSISMILTLFKGCIAEIEKLQKENDELKVNRNKEVG